MRDVVQSYRRWRDEGVAVGRGVVVRVYSSAPRAEGATMLVTGDGRIAGSVSGGCVEGDVAREVLEAFERGTPRRIRYGIADEDAWSLGLACGGTIEVLVEPEVPSEVAEAAASANAVGIARIIPPASTHPPDPEERPSPGPSSALVIEVDGPRGSLGDPPVDAMVAARARSLLAEGVSRTIESPLGDVFVEVFPSQPRLVVVGAGEIAVHLVPLAHRLGYHTTVIDGRAAFATPERFPEADRLLVGWADDLADEAGIDADANVAVLTHDPKFDDPALETALRRGSRYVGALGSRRTQEQRRERLRAVGLDESEIGRISGPIGLDLGGRTPPEIALAILAEIVATRHGRSGPPGRMSGAEVAPGR